MAVVIRITAQGALAISRDMEEMAVRAVEAGPAMVEVHALLLKVEEYQFKYGGKRGPHQWAPAAKSTRDRKRRAGHRYKLMYDTEELVNSLTDPADPHHVFEYDQNSLVFGSDLDQFEIQQGHDSGDGFPFRPPIDLTPTDERKATRIIEEYIIGAQGLVSP